MKFALLSLVTVFLATCSSTEPDRGWELIDVVSPTALPSTTNPFDPDVRLVFHPREERGGYSRVRFEEGVRTFDFTYHARNLIPELSSVSSYYVGLGAPFAVDGAFHLFECTWRGGWLYESALFRFRCSSEGSTNVLLDVVRSYESDTSVYEPVAFLREPVTQMEESEKLDVLYIVPEIHKAYSIPSSSFILGDPEAGVGDRYYSIKLASGEMHEFNWP